MTVPSTTDSDYDEVPAAPDEGGRAPARATACWRFPSCRWWACSSGSPAACSPRGSPGPVTPRSRRASRGT